MPAPPIYTMESANLFAGALPSDVTASNHLTLTEVKLPGMDQQFVDHRPGGGLVATEIDTVFARLECTFILLGWAPHVASLLAQWSSQHQQFFVYGNVRERISGTAVQAVAHLNGKLGRADPQNWRKGDVQHWNYSIRGITYYELTLGGDQIYFWDFYNNIFSVGGVSVMDDTFKNLMLGAPGASSFGTGALAPANPGLINIPTL